MNKIFFFITCCTLAGCLFFLFLPCCSKKKLPPSPAGYPKPYKIGNEWYQPLPHANGFIQRGNASWYGKKFHGKKTANGEIYDMYSISAAHKTLPLGTWVKVLNLRNNRELETRINDRGPFVRGRIIDLSFAAAKKLEIVDAGTAPVEIVALGVAVPQNQPRNQPQSQPRNQIDRSYVPVDYYKGDFTIQVGAFIDRKNAERLKLKLDGVFSNAHIITWDNGSETFYRVRAGSCSSLKQALEHENLMIQNGFTDAFAVAE